MSRNAILCRLLGIRAFAPLEADIAQSADNDTDGALLSLFYWAHDEDVDRFTDTLDALGAIDPEQLRILSSYCLMVGLSGRVQTAFMLFDALKSWTRTCPTIWLDLAHLQQAWGYLTPALRSQTMYRKLTGQEDGPTTSHLTMAPVNPGPIHILNGDLPSVRRL